MTHSNELMSTKMNGVPFRMNEFNLRESVPGHSMATSPFYVLKAISDLGSVSLKELTQATGISRPTLYRVLQYLDENEFISHVIGNLQVVGLLICML